MNIAQVISRSSCHTIVRLSVFVFLLVLLGACSTRFFYERIDWFVVWQVEGLVSLEDEQKKALKEDVQVFLDELRVNEMPYAAEWLDSIARDVEANELTDAAINDYYLDSMDLLEDVMDEIVPLSARFLSSLSDEQIAELRESLTEINDEMYEEYSGRTAEEREKNRNKSSVKGVERWTGRLNSEQKDLIKNSLASMSDSSEQWIAYQREWQESFQTLLLERPAEPEFSERLTELFVYPRDLHSDEYREQVEGNRRIFNQMMAELVDSLTNKQRKRLVKEFDGYAKKLTELSQLPQAEVTAQVNAGS